MKLSASSKIYIAGHRGLVGSALVRELARRGCDNLIVATRSELDLRDPHAVSRFFAEHSPNGVFLAAAKVGGILANSTHPAEFLYDNLAIQTSVIHAAWKARVDKLVFLGSSCIYPRLAPQPIKEESLLTGPLEPTNEGYAIAKIAGLKLAAAYRAQYGFSAISVMPTNLYGPGDNFDTETGHVVPALIRRLQEAKLAGASQVTLWGTGTQRREFMHVDDLASALCFTFEHYDNAAPLNIGVGMDVSIRELGETVARVVGYTGTLRFDTSKPDGTPRKLLDVTRLTELGWRPTLSLEEGLALTYAWYLKNLDVGTKDS
jgi:GDP-L-fucose synthase